jgi:hypothetical protein
VRVRPWLPYWISLVADAGWEPSTVFLLEDALHGDRERGAFEFSAGRGDRLSVRRAIAQHGVADAAQLVGQGTRRLVVIGPSLHRHRPGLKAVEAAPGLQRFAGSEQNGARAMREQHSQVAVALFGDATEPPGVTR